MQALATVGAPRRKGAKRSKRSKVDAVRIVDELEPGDFARTAGRDGWVQVSWVHEHGGCFVREIEFVGDRKRDVSGPFFLGPDVPVLEYRSGRDWYASRRNASEQGEEFDPLGGSKS